MRDAASVEHLGRRGVVSSGAQGAAEGGGAGRTVRSGPTRGAGDGVSCMAARVWMREVEAASRGGEGIV